MNAPARSPSQWLLATYYAGTALFFLGDYLLDVNVRIAFLDDYPGWRLLYYVFLGVCFALIWRHPTWSNTIASVESMITLAALILSMGIRVYVPVDVMLEGTRGVVTPNEIVNFLVSGGVAYFGILTRSKGAEKELRRNLHGED